MLYGQSFMESIVEAQVDGATLSAAAAASALPAAAKFTLPTNFLNRIGKQLLIKAHGRQSLNATPGTIRWRVLFGATAVFDGIAMVMDTAGYTTKPWTLEILLTCRAIGTAANFIGAGNYTYTGLAGTPATPPKGSLVALLPWDATPAVGSNFDSTATQQVDLEYTPSLGTASMTLHGYSLLTVN